MKNIINTLTLIAFVFAFTNANSQSLYSDSTESECELKPWVQTINSFKINIPIDRRVTNKKPGNLTFKYLGDLDWSGNEYLELFDENGKLIGNSNTTPTTCRTGFTNFYRKNFTIPKATLIKWLKDGKITFSVRSSNQVNPQNWGCDVLGYTNVSWCAQVALEYEYKLFWNDVGVSAINSPEPVVCTNNNDIVANITNFGQKNLSSANVNWNVTRNGVSSPIVTVPWIGNIQKGQSSQVYLGNFGLGFDHGDVVKVWTNNPNGVQDSSAENDTLKLELRKGFQGRYTVGGVGSDFKNISDLDYFIDSIGSVCDTTQFLFRKGNYNGQISLDSLWNSSATRPIIFGSETQNPVDVRVRNSNSTEDKNNHVFSFYKTNGIAIENLRIQNNSQSDFATAVSVRGEFDYFSLDGNIIESSYKNTVPYSSGDLISITTDTGTSRNIIITNNELVGGNRSLVIEGKNTRVRHSNIQIIGNHVTNNIYDGIVSINNESVIISNNRLETNSTTYFPSRAIQVKENNIKLRVENNEIYSESNNPSIGIELTNISNLPLNRGLVSNNFVSMGSAKENTTFEAITMNNCYLQNMYFNNVFLQGSNTQTKALNIIGGGGINVMNNSLFNNANGLAYFIDNSTGFPIHNSDNNDIYSSGKYLGQFGSFISNLLTWTNRTKLDQNSVSVDPEYKSIQDLHTCSQYLDNAGRPIPTLYEDIDGQVRNALTPDIGADEFASIKGFSLGSDKNVCKGTELSFDATSNLSDSAYVWENGDSDALRTINQPGSYSVKVYSDCGIAEDTISISIVPPVDLGNDTVICEGESVILSGNLPKAKYSWNNGKSSQNITVGRSGVYVLEATDTIGCITQDTIEVIKGLAVSLPSDTFICNGSFIFLTPNTGTGTYNWNNGQTTKNVLISNSDKYIVEFTDEFGCESSDSINVDFVFTPNATFSFKTFNSSAYTIAFDAPTYVGSDYLWTFGDGDTSSLEDPIHLYSNPGVYVATLEISNACNKDTHSKQVAMAVGINEKNISSNYIVFPNPADKYLNIQNQKNNTTEYRLFDATGRLIISQITIENTIQFDLSNLNSGIYSLEIVSDNQNVSKKIVVK